MRLLILPLCLALGGCLTSPDQPAGGAQPASGSQPAAGAPAEPAPSATTPRRPAQAARGSSAPPAEVPPERDPQYSGEQRLVMIRQLCWGQVDKNRALKTMDARIDWVEKCVADKRKEPLGKPAQ